MKKGKVRNLFLFLAIAVLISSPLAFAGFNELWAKLTGKATNAETSVSIVVGNTAPVIYYASPITAQGTAPSEASGLTINYWFNATDADGVNTLVNSTATINAFYNNDSYNATGSCAFKMFNSTSYWYNCTITLPYFASAGTYVFNVSVADQNGARASNHTTWALGTLNAMTINNTALSWGAISTSSTNVPADTNPIGINNTGNRDYININVTGYDLSGWSNPAKWIGANNFSAGTGNGCSGTVLANATAQNITAVMLRRGDNTTRGKADVNFCIQSINTDTPSDTFNTTKSGYPNWNVLLEPNS